MHQNSGLFGDHLLPSVCYSVLGELTNPSNTYKNTHILEMDDRYLCCFTKEILNMKWNVTLTQSLGALFLLVLLTGCENKLQKAQDYIKAKDYEMAAKTYKTILKEKPKHKEALKAITALYCGDQYRNNFQCYGNAKTMYELMPKDPKAAEYYKQALYASAYEFSLSSQLKRARDYLQKLLEMDKGNAKALFMLGLIKNRLSKKPPVDYTGLKEAAKLLQDAVKNSSKTTTIRLNKKAKNANLHWEAYFRIGNIYSNLIMKARKTFDKKNPPKKRGKGPKFTAPAKELAEALKAYKAASALSGALKDKGKKMLPTFQTAMIYANSVRDFTKALTWLQKAEQIDPNSPSVLGNIKMTYEALSIDAKKRRKRRLRRKYDKKAKEYAAKFQAARVKAMKKMKKKK